MNVPNDVLRPPLGNPDSLFSQVAEHIALLIVSGSVAVGDLIPNETTISGPLSVSRSVYREAVKFLSAKGLVESRPKSGTRAAPATAWNLLDPDVLRWTFQAGASDQFIRDLYELRIMIEPGAARMAAERRTPAQAAAIRDAYETMASTEPYSTENIRADVLFHDLLLDACGNGAFRCLRSVVMTTLMWSLALQKGTPRQDYAPALGDHARVCQAIETQDGARAEAVMRLLVHDALDDTLRRFRRRADAAKRAAAE
ncbi:MAG TPA: FadR/GntR family transcriptional regulator [Beijerinckiaceae bacterium]|nr:FadR/GntR family transcriptional regulator [Beijerinckiaceae bacterium]